MIRRKGQKKKNIAGPVTGNVAFGGRKKIKITKPVIIHNICIIGDSIALGIGDHPGGGGWAGRLRADVELRSPYAPGRGKTRFAAWQNLSAPGIGAKSGLSILPAAFYRGAHTVILALGVNDCIIRKTNGQIVSRPRIDRAMWRFVLSQLAKSQMVTYVIGLPPIDESRMPLWVDEYTELFWDKKAINRHNQILRDLCYQFGHHFIDIADAYAPTTRNCHDGVHPNNIGYDAIYRAIRRQLGLNFVRQNGTIPRQKDAEIFARIAKKLSA